MDFVYGCPKGVERTRVLPTGFNCVLDPGVGSVYRNHTKLRERHGIIIRREILQNEIRVAEKDEAVVEKMGEDQVRALKINGEVADLRSHGISSQLDVRVPLQTQEIVRPRVGDHPAELMRYRIRNALMEQRA